MCGFTWTSRAGAEHRCVREHRTAGPVMHVCFCGASLHPGRKHPEGHSEYVAREARRLNEMSRATATRRHQFWTPEEDLRLRELAVANVPVSRVARELGRTIASVRSRGRRLGVHVGSRSPRENHEPGVAPEEQDV